MSVTGGSWDTAERFGRPVRHFPIAVSAEALALAWARQEQGPQGATVIVDREISPLGRQGRLWGTPPEATLASAVVLRPPLSVEEADASWLVVSLAAAEGAEAVTGKELQTWWPDAVVEPTSGEPVGTVKAEVQLGPGQVRSAVVTVRLDLSKLGLEGTQRDELLEAVLSALDGWAARLDNGATELAAAYESRCRQMGRRVRVQLRPKGETRGTVSHIGRTAHLELKSATGMVERVTIDQLRDLTVVG